MANTTTDYLNPEIPADVNIVDILVRKASPQNLNGFGTLVFDNYQDYPIEIVRWPATGWRPVDDDSGDEAGTTQGVFHSCWNGDVLYGKNDAVNGHYIIGYSQPPHLADDSTDSKPESIYLWHANYHPDGGQLFYPVDRRPFVVPLALPGDDVRPDDFVCFVFDGTSGLYIHPGVWHEGVFTCEGQQRFFDKQGAVHARVSVNFPNEFHCLIKADISNVESILID